MVQCDRHTRTARNAKAANLHLTNGFASSWLLYQWHTVTLGTRVSEKSLETHYDHARRNPERSSSP
jgi:hypothetical protein